MIELPEARTISNDLRREIIGKKIIDVKGNFTDHKFTFYQPDPNQFKSMLINKTITNIIDRNFYIELIAEDYTILYRDGINLRYYRDGKEPTKSKLMLCFDDSSFLNTTTSMYCFICVFKTMDGIDNKYYYLDRDGIGPLDEKFTLTYFNSLITDNTRKLSLKAFLATEQRIPGIGNGVVQDILFQAKMLPKRKISTLSAQDIEYLYQAVVNTIKEMVELNGRDTEKSIYDGYGNYSTLLSSKTYKNGCPVCGNNIIKENYLGGSIYYCPICQK